MPSHWYSVSNTAAGYELRPGHLLPRPLSDSVWSALPINSLLHRTHKHPQNISISPPPSHFSAAFTWDTEWRRDWVVNDGAARCPETAWETNEWLVRHYIDHECLLVSHCNKEKGQMVYLFIWSDKTNCLLLIYERIIILKITRRAHCFWSFFLIQYVRPPRSSYYAWSLQIAYLIESFSAF